jgi:AcrR family transcriptional regulator
VAVKSIKAEQREATQARILGTAGRMFAASGYDGTSIRSIAAESGIELSLILYHFKSKEGLYRAVFQETAEAILHKRLDRLRKALTAETALSVVDILAIYCASWLDVLESERVEFAIIFARSHLDQSERQIVLMKEVLDPSTLLFIDALKHAAPDASDVEIHRCYHLFGGTLMFSILDHDRIVRISGEVVGDVRASMLDLAHMIERRLLKLPN